MEKNELRIYVTADIGKSYSLNFGYADANVNAATVRTLSDYILSAQPFEVNIESVEGAEIVTVTKTEVF